MKAVVAFGTRPEIIKLAAVVEEMSKRDSIDLFLLNTGQHFDWQMSGSFLADFELPEVDHILSNLPQASVPRLGAMLVEVHEVLERIRPDVILVQGDTTTAMAAAIAGIKARVPVAHVEAGLRSFNPLSPEELNRKLIAQMAAVHFAPTELSRFLLVREGVDPSKIEVVGNPVVDALKRMAPAVAAAESVIGKRKHSGIPVLVTIHRPGNTDRPERLVSILRAFLNVPQADFFFPIHPRTRKALSAAAQNRAADLAETARRIEGAKNIQLMDPLSYVEFTKLMTEVALVVTDSGGVQEEANALGKPVLTLRPSTPRWEGVIAGANTLCPTDAPIIAREITRLLTATAGSWDHNLYGDGRSAARIVDALQIRNRSGELTTTEPSYYGELPPPVTDFLASTVR